MKHVPLERLEATIVRPGLEKHLVPLLHFKGHTDLGRIHRLWNLVVSMQEHECESMADGLVRLQHNPSYSHLCLPDKKAQNSTLYGFLSRLQAKPQVAALHEGLLDYARLLMPRPFHLTPVAELSPRSRHAWWRTFDSRMAAWRELQASRRAERIAARQRERAARAEARAAARAERRALVLKHRAEIAEARRLRRLEQERKAREPKKFVLRESGAAPIAYPFLIHDGGRPEHDLLRAINSAVPKGIMGDLRADICQDLAVGVLCGDFSRDDLLLPAKEMIRRIRQMFPEKYGPLSLDALVPGTDNLRLIDTI